MALERIDWAIMIGVAIIAVFFLFKSFSKIGVEASHD